jgi:O-antigen/teichoic acid export membrane protein
LKNKVKVYFDLLTGRSFKFSTIGSGIQMLFGTVLSFLVSVVFVRLMSTSDYGLYIYSYSLVLLLSVFLTLGFPILLMRLIPKYEIKESYGLMRGLLIRINQFIFLSFLILSLISSILFFSFIKRFEYVELLTYIWSFLLLLTTSLNVVRASTLQGLRFSLYAQFPDTILKNIVLIIGVLIYYYFNNQIYSYEVMAFHFFSSIISFCTGNYILRLKLLRKIKRYKPIFETKKWFNEAITLSLNVGANKLKTKIPIFILSFYLGKSVVAVYDVAHKSAILISFLLNALNLSFGPHISNAFERKNYVYLRKIIKKSARIIFLASLPIFLIYLFFGEFFLKEIYGFEYVDSYIYLMIICVGQLFNLASGSVGLILNMTSNHKLVFKANLYNLIFNLFLTLILVYYFDILGASIAYAFSIITLNIVLVIIAKRKLELNTTIF